MTCTQFPPSRSNFSEVNRVASERGKDGKNLIWVRHGVANGSEVAFEVTLAGIFDKLLYRHLTHEMRPAVTATRTTPAYRIFRIILHLGQNAVEGVADGPARSRFEEKIMHVSSWLKLFSNRQRFVLDYSSRQQSKNETGTPVEPTHSCY